MVSTRSTKILARRLECGLHGFRTAANVEDMVIWNVWRMRNEIISQFLCYLRREEASMRVSVLVDLFVHGRRDVLMGVAEMRHGRACRGIDVFTGTVADDDAAGSGSNRIDDEGCGS